MADRSVAIVVNVNYWSRKIGRRDDTAREPHGIPYNREFEVGYYEKKSFDSKRQDT